VINVGIDGLGGEYLRNFTKHTPALQKFFDHGAYSTKSRNIAPTVSSEIKFQYVASVGSDIWILDWSVEMLGRECNPIE
jgi:hypothetical protein